MEKRILSQDGGVRTNVIVENGNAHIETVQDCKPIIERNKRLQREYRERPQKGDYKHIATIPNVVLMKFKKEYGLDIFKKDDLPKIEKLLHSNEFKYLRVVDKI